MNVIVSNKQKDIIDNANIDAIKDLNGLFSIDDLLSKFKNYFFSKMILDATSIVNFSSKEVLEKLALEIGGERLIILLPPSPEPPPEFVKKLVDLKIYNFSTNINDVVRFLTNPNTAETFANNIYSNDEQIYVDNSIKSNNNFNNDMSFANQNFGNGFQNSSYDNKTGFNGIVAPTNQYSIPQDSFQFDNQNNNEMKTDMPSMNNQGIPNMNGSQNMPMGMSDMNSNQNMSMGMPNMNSNQNMSMGMPNMNGSQNMSMGMPNMNGSQNMSMGMPGMNGNQNNGMIQNGFNQNMNMPTMNNNQNMFPPNNFSGNNMMSQNSFDNVKNPNVQTNNSMLYQNNSIDTSSRIYSENKKVYGIKNVTPHAGSTTLTYLLTKTIGDNLGKKVLGIEVDRHDFIYFPGYKNLRSVDSNELINVISSSDADVIFVDLNDYKDFSICNEVLFLVEPSTIKLNLLMYKSKFAFRALIYKKVILNKSMLSSSDVKRLASEAGIDFFMNIPPLNDRVQNDIIIDLFKKL